jgi:aryl-alcohol dehydrogenase-like predicted oxidoreductase
VLDRLAEIRTEGVTVGLSTSGPNQAATILEALSIERDGRRLFDTVQATWNLLEPSAGPALAAASAEGMGVIIKESVANGRLTVRDRASIAPLRATVPGLAPDAVAIAAVLAQPFVDVVLSGAATQQQLESNLDALRVDPEQLAALPDMAEEPDVYWARRSNLSWT